MKAQSKEKIVLEKELALSEKIRGDLTQGMDKLKQELKELKQIIKVPRLHYKHIDSIDYDDLKTQYDSYTAKEKAFVTETGINKAKLRSHAIMKKRGDSPRKPN